MSAVAAQPFSGTFRADPARVESISVREPAEVEPDLELRLVQDREG
jgi:hypothetical protein